MAAPTYHGKNASFIFSSGSATGMISWSLTDTTDVVPSTSVTDTVETYLAGMKDFTISAVRNADSAASTYFGFLGTSATAVCRINSSRYITAVCKMSQFTETVSISDKATESFQFQGSSLTAPSHT